MNRRGWMETWLLGAVVFAACGGVVAQEAPVPDILDPGTTSIEELLRLQQLQETVEGEVERRQEAGESFMGPGPRREPEVTPESLAEEGDVSLSELGLSDSEKFFEVLRQESREALGVSADEPATEPAEAADAAPVAAPEEGAEYDALQYSTPQAAAAMAARLRKETGVVVGEVGDPIVLRLPPPGNTAVVARGVLGYRLPLVAQQLMPSRVIGGLYIPSHRAYVVYREGQWQLTGERVEDVVRPRVVVREVDEPAPRVGLWRRLFGGGRR